MARKLRIQYEGAIYHVMNRGDHREDISRTVKDRELSRATLGEACIKTDWPRKLSGLADLFLVPDE